MSKLGRVRVTYELLEEVLGLPEGSSIRRVTHDEIYNRSFELVVHSPDLADVPDGMEIPEVAYSVTRLEGYFSR